MTEQTTEIQSLLTEIKSGWSGVSALPAEVKALREGADKLATDFKDVRRQLASRREAARPRGRGAVSDDCARHLAATFIAHCERSDKLDALCSLSAQRDALTAFARDTLNLSTRAALNTGDIPLPVSYSGEIRELISEFGVVRRCMSPYPIGMGTSKPARMGTRPAFQSIPMSSAFAEKSPQVTFASLESHKIGGIVRLPREIDEQSVVAMGQFLARYGAIEFARAEDQWGFLADGTPTFEGVKGILQITRDNNAQLLLAAGKVKPSDATLADFRNLRTKVNKAAVRKNGRRTGHWSTER